MKSITALFVAGLALLISPDAAEALEIDIKGIRLGLTEAELIDQFGATQELGGFRVRHFTVGGASSRNSGLELILDDGKLGEAYLIFYSSSFDSVLTAVRSKYPSLRCTNGIVRTGYGVTHQQTECSLKDRRGVLLLTRFLSDIDTSFLTLQSHERVKALMEHVKRREKDI